MFSVYNFSFNYIDIICVCSMYLIAFTYSFITLFDNSKKKYSPYIYISILSSSIASMLYMHYASSLKLSFLHIWSVPLVILTTLLFIFISKYDLQSKNKKTNYKYDYDYKRERYNFAIKNSRIDESNKYFDTAYQKTKQDNVDVINQQENNKVETKNNENGKTTTNKTNNSQQYFTETNSIKNNLLHTDNKDLKDRYNNFDIKIMKNLNTIKDNKTENAEQSLNDASKINIKIYEKNFEDKIMQQTKQVIGEMIIKGQEPLVHEIGVIKTDVQTLRDSLQGMIDRMAKLFSLMTTAMKN